MLNLIKLSVGTASIESLREWQKQTQTKFNGYPAHITRMWPKRSDEILQSKGSIYWIIQGKIQARQRLLSFEEVVGEDNIRRCAFVLEPNLIAVHPTPKRAFQGWRYLDASAAPQDLAQNENDADQHLPSHLSAALTEIGII